MFNTIQNRVLINQYYHHIMIDGTTNLSNKCACSLMNKALVNTLQSRVFLTSKVTSQQNNLSITPSISALCANLKAHHK